MILTITLAILDPFGVQKLHEHDQRPAGVTSPRFDHLHLTGAYSGKYGQTRLGVAASLTNGLEGRGGHCSSPLRSARLVSRGGSSGSMPFMQARRESTTHISECENGRRLCPTRYAADCPISPTRLMRKPNAWASCAGDQWSNIDDAPSLVVPQDGRNGGTGPVSVEGVAGGEKFAGVFDVSGALVRGEVGFGAGEEFFGFSHVRCSVDRHLMPNNVRAVNRETAA